MATTRVPDLHKSAFWIYGVTAMVMRDPLGTTLRQASATGWSHSAVQQEALRSVVVLLLMSAQFLSAGIFFDRVYLQPESGERFPSRSYPLDFLFGMGELLLAVGASTLVGVPTQVFDGVVAVSLLWEFIWLLCARSLSYSAVGKIAPRALFNAGALIVCAALRAFAGSWSAYIALILMMALQVVFLIRDYSRG